MQIRFFLVWDYEGFSLPANTDQGRLSFNNMCPICLAVWLPALFWHWPRLWWNWECDRWQACPDVRIATPAMPCKTIRMQVWHYFLVCVGLFLEGFLKNWNNVWCCSCSFTELLVLLKQVVKYNSHSFTYFLL